MAVTYSQDLRDRVLAAYGRGMETPQIAETFAVSQSWARRVRQVWRETGRTTPLPRGRATIIKINLERMGELVRDQPDATLRELRGRAPRGERFIDKSPHGHWKTTTLIAAQGVEGVRCSTVVDGAVNAAVFESFIEHVLVPELRPGDMVIMDNLSSHKRPRTRGLIESAGAMVEYLPPYSPDLNPIEMIFSKVKQLLRSLGCRTRDQL